ncbi:heparin lyase I family protein [Carnimonas bestiolae]|uniref:heparin lyase I family protein n=1 Tax=Carnimonas bestiolae TaxID=3402172 RepID=UPI003EDBE4CD
MKYLNFLCGSLLSATLVFSGYAQADAPSQPYQLKNAARCAPHIGRGGNLEGHGIYYKGKCEGNGEPPSLDGGNVLEFKASGNEERKTDRSELAATLNQMQLGKQYYISVKMRIPKETSVTNDFFYVMQFWQGPNFSPLAGIRITRGTSHGGMLMARDKKYPRGHSVAKIDFSDGKWKNLIIGIRVKKNGRGAMQLYDTHARLAQWNGRLGYSSDKRALSIYRLKFGIYKAAEPGGNYQSIMTVPRIFDNLEDARTYFD